MFGRKYVWMLLGVGGDSWWRGEAGVTCSDSEMDAVMRGHFTVETLSTIAPGQISISGMVSFVMSTI